MRILTLLSPQKLIIRLALEISKRKRLKKLKNTPGKYLKAGHIDSLELLEAIIGNDPALLEKAVIYDIGSNTGSWTLLAKSLLPGAEVHAFEPLETHIAAFNKHCNGLEKVILHPYCLGNENNKKVLNISSYSDSF